MEDPLNLVEPDTCCADALHAALSDGLDAEVWTHETCGQEWRAMKLKNGMRYWHPHCVIEVLR